LTSCNSISRDEDLLDSIFPEPIVEADLLIEIAKIQWAAEKLHNTTIFLGEIDALNETIQVVQASVNDLIAGPNRTLADLFDFTGKFILLHIIRCYCALSDNVSY
jgi:hypothetical protein